MLETVGNNRNASIIFDSGKMSDPIKLETGRPQGENLSPNQYNIGQQIVLFRIELDTNLTSVFQHFLGPMRPFAVEQVIRPSNKLFQNESDMETVKGEGFADDTNALCKRSKENIQLLKKILVDFALISGLVCNFDKTSVIPVGPNADIRDGFNDDIRVESSFTLLGMEIDNKLSNLQSNFDKTIDKIGKCALYWSRFNLTLPGRIAVAKTFMLSLINHIGCILMPSNTQIDKMQTIVDRFCIGKLNVSKERLYLPIDRGGCGLVNIRDFLVAQHTIWLKRANISTRDNWRVMLRELGWGNVFTTDPSRIDKVRHPILSGLSHSFSLFYEHFTNIGENCYKAFVFNNKAFHRSGNDSLMLDCAFFGKTTNKYVLSRLRFCDFFMNGIFKDYENLNDVLGLNLSQGVYFRLRSALLHYIRGKKIKDKPVHVGITEFFGTFKKGSKNCRKILGFKKYDSVKILEVTSVNSFFIAAKVPPCDDLTARNAFSLWNCSFLPNRFREFLYKFFFNKLGLNVRTVHFGGLSRMCSFCAITLLSTHDETFEHLFFACPTVSSIHREIENTLLGGNYLGNQQNRSFWMGLQPATPDNKFLRLFYLGIQYFIWEAKLKKTVPSANFLVGETVQILDTASERNFDLHYAKSILNNTLSRNWELLRARRW